MQHTRDKNGDAAVAENEQDEAATSASTTKSWQKDLRRRSFSTKSSRTTTTKRMEKQEQQMKVDKAAAPSPKSQLKIFLWGLLFLHFYIVEGVVQGLSSVVPLLLQPLGFGYAAKGTFSIIWWSYLGRLFFAPIIDTFHPLKKVFPSLPRHIAWIVGLELTTAGILVVAIYTVAPMFLGDESCEVSTLTYVFLGMNLMMALHKIAVDSWASSELQGILPSGYASSIESMGFTVGHILSYTVLAVFHPDPSGKEDTVPPEDEIIGLRVGMKLFMSFWCIVLVISSILIFSLTPRLGVGQNDLGDTDNKKQSTFAGFSSFGRILTKRNVILLILLQLTCRLPFIILKSGGDLAFVSRGIDLSMLAKMQLFMVPVEIMVQWWAGYMSSRKGKSILYLWKMGFMIRIILQLLYVPALMWITYINAAARSSGGTENVRPFDCDDFVDYEMPTLIDCIGDVDEVPLGGSRLLSSVHHAFNAIGITQSNLLGVVPLAILHIASQLALVLMTVPQRAFFREIADPALSGSYITLLNTSANLGAMWPAPLVLGAVDWWKHCDPNTVTICAWKQDYFPNLDSYETVLILSAVYGLAWMALSDRPLTKLENAPKEEWVLPQGKEETAARKVAKKTD